MKTQYKKFKEGVKVKVADYYLSDESTESLSVHNKKNVVATVLIEPTDSEALIMIEYKDKGIDYVPQDILEIIKSKPQKTKYRVQVTKYYSITDVIEVKASSDKEARDLAEEEMGTRVYNLDALSSDDVTCEILK